MLITNGSKIVTIPSNMGDLEDIQKTLKSRAKDRLGIKSKFPIIEDKFPYIESDISFEDLKQVCSPDIDVQFRAIGPEKVQLPTTRMKDIKHVFSPEEKQVIADNLCNIMYEKEKLEAEAKSVAKDYKTRIDVMETSMSDLGLKHRQGYEQQSVECNLHLDFENKTRIYTDLNSTDVLSVEPLEPSDYQLKLDFGKNGEFEAIATDDTTGDDQSYPGNEE